MGAIYSRDQKAYDRYRRSAHRPKPRPLADAALESAVMRIASVFPDNVTRGMARG